MAGAKRLRAFLNVRESTLMQQSRRWFWLEASCVCLALCACSSDDDTPGKPKPHRDAGRSDSGKPTNPGFGDGGFNPGLIDASGINVPDEDAGDGTRLVLTPGTGMVTLDSADPKSVEFKAELSSGGPSEVPVRWSIDHRDVGTIDAGSGAFKPNGAAGVVTVTAKAGSLTTSVTITIVVKAKLEGDPDSGGTMPAGAGGLGGVGGEGGGTKITDKPLRDALDKPATADADLKWLYPYDGTVWPRGLPAPLLQWSHGAHAPAAVKLKIQVEPNYTAEIYLGPPTALGSGKPITRVPIPQAVWRNALQSGAKMKVSLTAAVSDGSGGYAAYSAASELSWTIAPTTLRGTVYYNSYGTKLAENYDGAKGGNNRFGGATLAIQRDAFDPTLIAGSTTTDSSGCRVCHVVASDGARMIAQHANNMVSSAYDLRDMNKETNYDAAQNGKFGWAALSPDGTIALGNSGPPGTNNPSSTASLNQSALYKVSDGTALTAQGFSEFVTQAATPAFSLDMKKVAFNFYSGPGNGSIMGNGRSLVVMDLAKVNDSTYGFTNPKAIYVADADKLAGWPFFLPDGSGVVFQLELKPGLGSEHFATRNDARGELWWADLEGRAHALERANGKGYLPVMAMGHADDATLQFEPTVAPLVAGGYAWVVFTSRRAYGNVATRNPAESDPRDYDLTPGNAGGPTTKKLWVTALDVPAKPDTDPSHPAFYLPAQEIYAGNSRGFWVLDACEENGKGCTGGDECCGGFCKLDPESGQGICGDIPDDACSNEYDKCNVDSDCCADTGKKLYCIGGRCGTTTLL
jgi:hypothetical protein